MQYIVDINVLLHEPAVLKNPSYNFILLPTLFREMEKLEQRKGDYRLQMSIRDAKRMIESVKNNNNITFITQDPSDKVDFIASSIGKDYDADYADNLYLSYAVFYNNNTPTGIVTNDILLSHKAKSLGITSIKSDDISKDSHLYTGVYVFNYDKTIDEHNEIYSNIYKYLKTDEKYNPFDLFENEYLEVVSDGGVIDSFKCKNGKYVKTKYLTMENDYDDDIVPANERQQMAFDLMLDEDVPVKCLLGTFGVGKDYTIINYSLQVQKLEDKQIIWIGNPVITRGTQEIGFLPGTQDEKLKGSYMVLADVIGDEGMLDYLIMNEKIKIEYVGNLRSRTFNDATIIVGEAQNYTIEQLQLIISRVGINSELILNGDIIQSDIDYSGLPRFINSLKKNKLYGQVTLTDVERSEVAKLSLEI